ncbi:MAG: transcriptional repressor LexA [Planctomycetota bacterium]
MTFYTERQLNILEFLKHFKRMRGVYPTLEEIAQNFGVSKVTVHDHMRQLEKKGAIRREPHLARALEMLDPLFLESDSAPVAGPQLQVLGRIAAGGPIEAIEDPYTLDLTDLIPMGREHYALRVQGESMIDEGIRDGDLVIVERRSHAADGETVVAVLPDNEATLKKLYREKTPGGLRYRLQPANETLAPIYTDQLEVRGVVVGVVRRY